MNATFTYTTFAVLALFANTAFADSCSQYANTYYCDNGHIYSQYGNTTYGSDGKSWSAYGNTTYGADGSSFSKYGNALYDTQGNSWSRYGNSMYSPDGVVCSRYNHTVYCPQALPDKSALHDNMNTVYPQLWFDNQTDLLPGTSSTYKRSP